MRIRLRLVMDRGLAPVCLCIRATCGGVMIGKFFQG